MKKSFLILVALIAVLFIGCASNVSVNGEKYSSVKSFQNKSRPIKITNTGTDNYSILIKELGIDVELAPNDYLVHKKVRPGTYECLITWKKTVKTQEESYYEKFLASNGLRTNFQKIYHLDILATSELSSIQEFDVHEMYKK